MSFRLRNPLKMLRSNALALDMGTGNTRIARPEGEVILEEPTVVAIDQHTDSVLATGAEAKSYIGKAPERIRVARPLEAGVIRDLDAAKLLLGRFLSGILPNDGTRTKATVVVPQGVSDLDRRSLSDCCKSVGFSRVDLVSAPLAAAIGAGLDVTQPVGRLLLGIGAGLAEASVISLSGVIHSESLACGGQRLVDDIVQHLAQQRQVAIGENMAEQILKDLVCVAGPCPDKTLTVSGKSAATGSPCSLEMTHADFAGAADAALDELEALVRRVMEHAPAELVGDIGDTGLLLYGGAARLAGLDRRFGERLGFKAVVAGDPLHASLIGAAAALRPDLDFRKILVRA